MEFNWICFSLQFPSNSLDFLSLSFTIAIFARHLYLSTTRLFPFLCVVVVIAAVWCALFLCSLHSNIILLDKLPQIDTFNKYMVEVY